MAIAIISDVHANADALRAVLTDIASFSAAARAEQRTNEVICEIHCLGDIVNYGAEPAECVKLVRNYCKVALRGNHDEAVATQNPVLLESFGKHQADAARWTRDQLSDDDVQWLAGLPHQHLMNGSAEVHGTLCTQLLASDIDYTGNPDKNLEYATFTRYVSHRKDKKEDIPNLLRCFRSLQELGKDVCFIGHVQKAEGFWKYKNSAHGGRLAFTFNEVHAPQAALCNLGATAGKTSVGYFLRKGDRTTVIDVGSVGQPRDNDPRASYGIYAGDWYINRRVPYDIKAAAAKITAVAKPDGQEGPGLFSWFADRLFDGK
jgi:hypothetical protein